MKLAKLSFLIFVLLGAGFVAGMAYSRMDMKRRMERMGRGEMDAEHMIRRFSKALNLTEEQKKVIQTKLKGKQAKWSLQRQEMRKLLKAQTQDFLSEILVDLNPEQIQKLERFQARMSQKEPKMKKEQREPREPADDAHKQTP